MNTLGSFVFELCCGQTDKQTDKQTDSKVLPTPTDRVGVGNERSVIFKEEDDGGRERVTEEEERVTIKGESTEIKFRR